MKVETDLTPRDHAFILPERLDLLFDAIVVQTRVVRMRADRGVDVFVRTAKLDCTLERAAMRIARAHVEDHGHARGLRSLEHCFANRLKLRPIKMRVRISKHRLFQTRAIRDVFGKRRNHRPAFFAVGSSDDHALRLITTQLAWLQIRDNNTLATDDFLGLVVLRDAREYLSWLLFTDIN